MYRKANYRERSTAKSGYKAPLNVQLILLARIFDHVFKAKQPKLHFDAKAVWHICLLMQRAPRVLQMESCHSWAFPHLGTGVGWQTTPSWNKELIKALWSVMSLFWSCALQRTQGTALVALRSLSNPHAQGKINVTLLPLLWSSVLNRLWSSVEQPIHSHSPPPTGKKSKVFLITV